MTPREKIRSRRLYLVCDASGGRAHPGDLAGFLDAALRGGVDVVQLRDKGLDDDGLVAAAATFRTAADRYGALFVINDRPDLVLECSADGVHVGQDDLPPAAARAMVGPTRLVGLSTHSQEDAARAVEDPDVDYIAVGPVHATPTKPGRPAVGLEYVRHAAYAIVGPPWFAIGGLDVDTIGAAVAAGARRAVVVRALTESDDVERDARRLRTLLDPPAGSLPDLSEDIHSGH